MDGETKEVERFFSYLRILRDSVADEYASTLEARAGVPKNVSTPMLIELCEDILFRLCATIDGVSGPDDFPEIEIAMLDSDDSLNASPLHELFYDYMHQ